MANESTALYLTITRVDGPVYDGEVASVTLPGAEGDMTILARHEALISPLRPGTIVVKRTDGTEETFDVVSGTVEVSNNQTIILL